MAGVKQPGAAGRGAIIRSADERGSSGEPARSKYPKNALAKSSDADFADHADPSHFNAALLMERIAEPDAVRCGAGVPARNDRMIARCIDLSRAGRPRHNQLR
ncbi:MAG: hypothetical protein V2I67_06230 [Thermoanaerobaculales bacterium]|jgi:hypothetical protein|nr:hypothetical protein [Thermoanaerobaculales bacterium]